MILRKAFMEISKVPGVDQYLLVDQKGKIFIHAIDHPETAAQIVSTCGNTSSAVGKSQFQHLIFHRKAQKKFFIFPVGNYYLGVVKSVDMDTILFTKNIVNFLHGLLNKK